MTTSCSFGVPMFSASLEVDGDKVSVAVSAVPQEPRHFERVPFVGRSPLGGTPREVLGKICDAFPSLAGRFAGDSSEEGEFDLGMLAGRPGPMLRRRGLFIRVEAPSGEEMAFRSESVIVIEVIMALASELASMVKDDPVAGRWSDILGRCELISFPSDDWDSPNDMEQVMVEARWYSDKLGQSLDYYRDAAVWLHARQHLSAFEHVNVEPSGREYRVDFVLDLPDSEEIAALVRRVCDITERSADDFIGDAIHSRNVEARQEVIYRRWYGDPRIREAEVN